MDRLNSSSHNNTTRILGRCKYLILNCAHRRCDHPFIYGDVVRVPLKSNADPFSTNSEHSDPQQFVGAPYTCSPCSHVCCTPHTAFLLSRFGRDPSIIFCGRRYKSAHILSQNAAPTFKRLSHQLYSVLITLNIMAIGDIETGFRSFASSGCLVMSFALPMFAVVVGGVCCYFGGAIACGHRILRDAYLNDPRFSAPILSSFEAGIVGCIVIVIPCSFIIMGMKGCCARSGSDAAQFTVGTLLKHAYQQIPLVAAAGAVGTAILRHSDDMVVLAPGWAAVCGLLGSVVITAAAGIPIGIMICCGGCSRIHLRRSLDIGQSPA